jgi:hypothetical protein
LNNAIPFSSECPRCNQERVQTAYSRGELLQLLGAGAEIGAYCMSCDREWPISVEERADLAQALSR